MLLQENLYLEQPIFSHLNPPTSILTIRKQPPSSQQRLPDG